MKLLNDLISSVSKNEAPVRDVRVGITWTGVWGKRCGLGRTYASPATAHCCIRGFGRLTEKTTLELAEYARSWHLVEAAIGVAAINSMIKPKGKRGINALDLILELGKNKRVTMVGAFPRTSELRAVAKEFWLLELDPYLVNPEVGILPATAAEHKIPKSDLVVVTGSGLVNKSLEHLLELSGDAYTIVLGPSTSMSEVLFDYGADLLAGVDVIKPAEIMKKISQSGGMVTPKNCKGEIEFLVMEK
ncbi:hypothetical protein ES703_00540 [subsurface metagenome]